MLLIVAGVLALLGLGLLAAGWLGLGRLPGDFVIRHGRTTIFVPLATSLLVSLLLTLLLWLLRR